jgi:hypothetical protein
MGGERNKDEERNSGGRARKVEKANMYFTLPELNKKISGMRVRQSNDCFDISGENKIPFSSTPLRNSKN